MKMTKTPLTSDRQKGMSLLSVLVGVAMLGVFAQVVSTTAGQAMQSAKIIRALNEGEDVRNVIRTKTSCSQTKTRNTGSAKLFLYDKNGATITKSDGTYLLFDKWRVRVTAYNAANGAFAIQADHPDQPGGFKDLFRVAPFSCK